MPATIQSTTFGKGTKHVLVLHDWYCDHTSWDHARSYLSPDAFTYVFADLRGYGKSRDLAGAYDLEEAAADVVELADQLGWQRFSVCGHSMSGLIVQRLAQVIPGRLERIVAITPVPPMSLKLPGDVLGMLQGLALASDEVRLKGMLAAWGDRLSPSWVAYKARKWRETAKPEAVAKYAEMWGTTDISALAKGVVTPMLVIAGAHDAPYFQPAAYGDSLLPFYPNAELVCLSESGHYPMEEQPPLFATVVERYLGR